jgi:HEAT repeat protein
MISPQQLLDEIHARRAGIQDRLRTQVDASTILAALRLTDDAHARQVLCDALGFRHEHTAVDDLIRCLEDPSAGVRSSAADALAKIGDGRAGAALLARFELPDPNLGVRRMLLAALGAVGHRPAIPLLIRWLGNPDPSQRGSAAWSLGAMHVEEALPALEEALRSERIDYPRQRLREAIEVIRAHSPQRS